MDNYQIARRAQIGVVIPSTNTGVEYDLQKFNVEFLQVVFHPCIGRGNDHTNLCASRYLIVIHSFVPIQLAFP